MSNPLKGVRIKINRAKEHFGNLKSQIIAFQGRNPYEIVKDANPKTGNETRNLKFKETIPEHWGSILGDCVHNLRSSLDLLAAQLVILNGNRPTSYTAFPIGCDRMNFVTSRIHGLDGASDLAIEVTKRLTPYGGAGGNDTFWRLHRLDIADKHQILVPVAARHLGIQWTTNSVAKRMADLMGVPVKDMPVHTITLRPAEIEFPLQDGAILMDSTSKDGISASHGDADLKFVIDISFGEGQIFNGEPVVPTLKQLIDFTEGIINVYATEVLKTEW